MAHPPRIPVWLQWDQRVIYFITFCVANRAKVGDLVGALKRWTRQELHARWQWQPGSFDRLLRREESAHEKWLYIEENPVRAGLVKRAQDWPYRVGFDE